MNLRVQLNYLLPVWLLIWVTAGAIFTDLAFLEVESDVSVTSLDIRPGYKSGKNCELGLLMPEGNVQRITDAKTCQQVAIGDSVKLKQTKLLKRWLSLYDHHGERITSDTLENAIITDGIFVFIALLLPVLLMVDISGKILRVTTTVFGIEVLATLYYWPNLLG
jgi:hypothetical protein